MNSTLTNRILTALAATMLSIALLALPALADPPTADSVDVTVNVPAVMTVALLHPTLNQPIDPVSTTLGFDDYEATIKSLGIVGRTHVLSNTNYKLMMELEAGGTFSDGDLELWVKSGSASPPFFKAEEGTPTELASGGPTPGHTVNLRMEVRNISWEETGVGPYTETLTVTIIEDTV